jgi:hypothetical protein
MDKRWGQTGELTAVEMVKMSGQLCRWILLIGIFLSIQDDL